MNYLQESGAGRGHRITADELTAEPDAGHTHASHAVMNGVPVPAVDRMLGHSDVRTTLRYAHLGDREIEAAAERLGQSIAALLRI